MLLANWGNYPRIETTLVTPETTERASDEIKRTESLIGRGLGRCYGDSASNTRLVLSTQRLNHMLAFDPESGLLAAEAGVSLSDIVDEFVPRGWFLPVTPGTKFVTLGGAVASDVHGKNHHISGTFGQHVAWVDIITAEKGLVRCSPEEHSELFHATCGGHGLTGFIVRVAVRLVPVPSAWIAQTTIKTASLSETMEAFETWAHAPYSVAWIDCLKTGASLGRSILMCGDFARLDQLGKQHDAPHSLKKGLPLTVPFDFPSLALNSFSVRAFNALYYGKAPHGIKEQIVSCNSFFYPLDAINRWNRIYGKRGFTQYQFVIPKEAAQEGLPLILKRIAGSGAGSFLAVLKLFGHQPQIDGNLSFPMEGYTLALDFPITQSLFGLLELLDAMVLDYGGRIYLTKDVRMSADTFHRGYARTLDSFLSVKSTWDPTGIFASVQSKRLGIGA